VPNISFSPVPEVLQVKKPPTSLAVCKEGSIAHQHSCQEQKRHDPKRVSCTKNEKMSSQQDKWPECQMEEEEPEDEDIVLW